MSPVNIHDDPKLKSGNDDGKRRLTSEQLRDLNDSETQERYRRAYCLQQARRSCPGCGEYAQSF